MNYMTDQDNNILNMAKEDPNKFYQLTIDSLLLIDSENKILIYTLLNILFGYMNDINFSDEDKSNHDIFINSVFNDYDIENVVAIHSKIKECVNEISIRRLNLMPVLGGIQ